MFLILLNLELQVHTCGIIASAKRSLVIIRGITADQSNENMDIGRFIHESAYHVTERKWILWYEIRHN